MIYVIKNDADEYLSFSAEGDSVWNKDVGHFETSEQRALVWSQMYGGTVYPCFVAIKPVEVTDDEQ